MQKQIIFCVLMAVFSACEPVKEVPGCVEVVDPACACPANYDPVCGCNGKTYGNACQAECANIKQYVKGECPAKLEGPVWQLTAFVKGETTQEVPALVKTTIKFDQVRAGGHGGCNVYGSTYKAQANNLTVTDLISTKIACQEASVIENKFFEWLGKSQTYAIQGNVLKISGSAGTLVFQRQIK